MDIHADILFIIILVDYYNSSFITCDDIWCDGEEVLHKWKLIWVNV